MKGGKKGKVYSMLIFKSGKSKGFHRQFCEVFVKG